MKVQPCERHLRDKFSRRKGPPTLQTHAARGCHTGRRNGTGQEAGMLGPSNNTAGGAGTCSVSGGSAPEPKGTT